MREILDVSNIVYGGHYGSPNFRIAGFPCGGVRKLLGIINADIRQSDFIICFDGGSTIKKELLPRYKAGRIPNYSVMAQLDLLREILLDCEIPYYWDEKYEADDFICSSVDFLTRVKDPDDIAIYSDDKDMACCISDKVRIRNVTTNGSSLDRKNFEEQVIKGTVVPYNTVLVHKMIFGDSSDNYLGLNIPGLRFDTLANFTVDAVTPYIERGQFPETAYMNVAVMEAIIDMLPESITDSAKQQLKAQARIVFPQLVDITSNGIQAFLEDVASAGEPMYKVERRHIKTFGQGSFNQKRFDYYCSIFGLNRCRPERISARFGEEAEDFKNTLKMRAKDLSSGVMAVERYQKKRAVKAEPTTLQNMQLPL